MQDVPKNDDPNKLKDQPKQSKHAGGRPLKYETVQELDDAIAAYFDGCDPHIEERMIDSGVNQKGETIFAKRRVMTEQIPYTMSDLARAIGLSRQGLLNYEGRDEFVDSIVDAKARCEGFAERMLYSPYSNGAKFNLTNNYKNWTDKSAVDHTTNGHDMPAAASLTTEELRKLAAEQ